MEGGRIFSEGAGFCSFGGPRKHGLFGKMPSRGS